MLEIVTTSVHGTTEFVYFIGGIRYLALTRYQDALVEQVASVNNNTIVVVNTVGPILVEAWIDNPNGS